MQLSRILRPTYGPRGHSLGVLLRRDPALSTLLRGFASHTPRRYVDAKKLFSPPRNSFSTSIKTATTHTNAPRAHGMNVVEMERREIETLESLLTVIAARAPPEKRSTLPLRSQLWSESLNSKSRGTSDVIPQAPKPEELLASRSMQDSFTQDELPLASSLDLFEQYSNASGGIRTGKLMERLDSFAGSVAYKHVLGPDVRGLQGGVQDRGFYIVTAAVERIDAMSSLTHENVRDLRFSGNVIYVGSSSMEVVIKVAGFRPGETKGETVMIARFTMVCRDAVTHSARRVPLLSLSTPEEEQLFALGEANKERKKNSQATALSQQPPSSHEARILHQFMLENRNSSRAILREGSSMRHERIGIKDTKLENTLLMFPQERNIHQKIFGGYLMRLAYELGFTNASLFAGHSLRFLCLDGISFIKPVPIGSVLRLSSQITHTASHADLGGIVHVEVQASVIDIATRNEEATNTFHFTWHCGEGKQPTRIVIPETYEEAMRWLEGQRALQLSSRIVGGRRERKLS